MHFKEKKLVIDLQIDDFADKIVYLLLEIIILDLERDKSIKYKLNIIVNNNTTQTKGFFKTPLGRSIDNKQIDFQNEYIKCITDYEECAKEVYYRKFYKREDIINHKLIESETISDVYDIFDKYYSYINDVVWKDSISKMVAELLCNAKGHSDGDVLIDLHVFWVDENKIGLDLAFINISDINFYEKTQVMFEKGDTPKTEIYETLKNSIRYQLKNRDFNEEYTKEHFYMFCNFQRYVSSRATSETTKQRAGTGLAQLMSIIIKDTIIDKSYVLSGDKILKFDKLYLNINEDIFTLNKEKDINKALDIRTISNSYMDIPGTVFNVYLVKEVR